MMIIKYSFKYFGKLFIRIYTPDNKVFEQKTTILSAVNNAKLKITGTYLKDKRIVMQVIYIKFLILNFFNEFVTDR